MRNARFLIVITVALGASGSAYALPCDNATACENPSFNASTQSGWVTSASQVTGIKALNSVGPTGNVPGSRYYFAASSTDQGATLPKGSLSTSGTGTEVLGAFVPAPSPGVPGTIINGGVVQNLLGNRPYFFYVQACGPSEALDSANCSIWVRVGNINTAPYPTSVFLVPQAPADATVNSISVRPSVPTADGSFISSIQLEIDNMLGGPDQSGINMPWVGNGLVYVVNNTLYTAGGGFTPNTKYQYRGQVFYPYGVLVPTAGPQTRGPFWTTPVNPSNVTVSNITHCSADITARNTGGSVPNPTYTSYRLCAGATCATPAAIGGSPAPTDTITRTVSGLVPGTNYTPNAQALVGNGDGSQTGWNSSSVINGTGFSTLGTNGTFTISNITTTSADFNFPAGFDVSGAVSWQRRINGVLSGPVVPGLPPSTIAFTGLTPNTQYNVQVTVNEASCSYTVPPTALTFTTTPNVPQTFALTATGPRALSASWAANGNPGATVYQVQRCLDAGFTSGCVTVNSAAGATSLNMTTGILPETTYHARVRALTVGGGQNSGYSNSDSATTPNEAPTVNTATCSVPGGNPTTSTCSGTVTDNGPSSELRCAWSATGPGSVTFSPSTPQTATGASTPFDCPNVTATFPINGSYTLTLTVTDSNGTGLSGTRNVTVNVGQVPTTITVAPLSATVQTGNTQVFTATVRDQFTNVMPGQSVNWSVTGGGSVNPSGPSTTFSATTPGGPFTLTASVGSATPGTASITVVAAGPFFATAPDLVINAGNLTGALTALGGDNVDGEAALDYQWTLESGPSSISVSPNNSNAAKNATVTFNEAGTYVIRCTLRSRVSGLTNSALTPARTVIQILSAIQVSPTGITINKSDNQIFTATGLDQFNDPMALTGTVNWSTDPGHSISAGAFTPGALGNNIRVSASQGSINGSAFVNVVEFDVSGAKAYPVPYKSTTGGGTITFSGLGSQATIRIYTISGRQVFSVTSTDPSGIYSWNVKNSSGENLASGVYLYVIESPTTTKNGKLIIIQ